MVYKKRERLLIEYENETVISSLHDIAEAVTRDNSDYFSVVDDFLAILFLDIIAKGWGKEEFPMPIDTQVFMDEPEVSLDTIYSAHLAGMAEYLAFLSGVNCPKWCLKDRYFLKHPIFIGNDASKIALLRTTPSAFRRRLVFSGNPITSVIDAIENNNNESVVT